MKCSMQSQVFNVEQNILFLILFWLSYKYRKVSIVKSIQYNIYSTYYVQSIMLDVDYKYYLY